MSFPHFYSAHLVSRYSLIISFVFCIKEQVSLEVFDISCFKPGLKTRMCLEYLLSEGKNAFKARKGQNKE